MYIFYRYLVLILAPGLSWAKDGEPLPAKSYQLSCTFHDNLCTWIKDASSGQQFVLSGNVAKINNPPNGCKYLVQSGVGSNELSLASIESPEFMTLPNMLLLQVNISFWIQNSNQSAFLKLVMVPLEGKKNGTQIDVWKTDLQVKYHELWNLASVNIKSHEAHRMKLILQGSASSTEDVIGINEIILTEITENEKTDLGSIPDSTMTFTNESTCQSDATKLGWSSLSIWTVFLSLFYIIK